ncbi:dihydrodipicolinate synthase family protein [Agromyces mangrovi Wang et al. 2018]|uniref:dihydrodipicolinate synthase family protein n=1 Tax=Agromyces mangrovi TaxID=1858653 RepID=UPI0025735638|nr:dihydrodipicolinate synthase family protein [Agromyces mangrovi]BDZ64135.1 dihydrodipicolinate synthase family protein [Agromyces mangrovi]
MQSPPAGIWPVMLTPYDDGDRVDLDVLDRYTDWLIERGAAGLFPVALSGEMYELSHAERLEVAARVVARAAGRVPVCAAVAEPGSPDETADRVAELAAVGVDIVVLVASVVLAEQDDESALRTVVDAVLRAHPDVVLGIYECPLPYHRVLGDETVAWLAHTGRFAFFKETSHDVERMRARVAGATGTPMRIFNAGIESFAESIAVGVSGLSGWVANVYPDAARDVFDAAHRGDAARAESLQASLVEVEERMGPTYPGSAKHLVELRAGIGMRTSSRWRPAEVDATELARVREAAEAEVRAG